MEPKTNNLRDEENFRAFFNAIDDILVVGNKSGQIIYCNNATSSKLGYTLDELKNMQVLDLNPKSKRKEAEQIFSDMFAGKRSTCPLPLERKDGVLIPAETRVWFGKWNGEDCIFGISKDLSVEQEALQKFNMIFDYNPNIMAISSVPEQKFTDVNQAFVDKLGYGRDELLGKTATSLGLFVMSEKQRIASEELKNKGLIHNIELEVKTKSGKILEGLFSGEIIESQGKKYFLTVMVDQTENILAKRELEERNAELEKLNKIMIDRELKMVELKKELKEVNTEK